VILERLPRVRRGYDPVPTVRGGCGSVDPGPNDQSEPASAAAMSTACNGRSREHPRHSNPRASGVLGTEKPPVGARTEAPAPKRLGATQASGAFAASASSLCRMPLMTIVRGAVFWPCASLALLSDRSVDILD
jgi:hypothetical protein